MDIEQQAVFRGHTDAVYSVAFQPTGYLLASASRDCTLCIWDTQTGTWTSRILTPGSPREFVVWNPTGEWLASTGADHGAVLVRYDGQRIQVAGSARRPLVHVAFHPHESLLAGAVGSVPGRVGVWHVPTGQLMDVLDSREPNVRPRPGLGTSRVAWSADGAWLGCGDVGGRGAIWHWPTRTLMHQIPAPPRDRHGFRAILVHFSLGGEGLPVMMTFTDSRIRIWYHHGMNGQTMHYLCFHACCVSPRPQGDLAASYYEVDNGLKLWSVASRTRLAHVRGHQATVLDVAWSRNGGLLASASADSTVRLWRIGPSFVTGA